MKSKYIQYFLLLVTLVIWGWIFISIYNHFSNSENKANHSEPIARIVNNEFLRKKDTFSLIANYRDPFLGNNEVLNTNNNGILSDGVKNATFNNWPNIEYLGYVTISKNKPYKALIRINSKSLIVSEKDSVSNVFVSKIFRDSLQVQLLKQKHVYKKK